MSREQPTQNLLDYYDDDFEDYEPEDISLYEMDNSAVEKAAYQIGMAGSIEPTALNNVSLNETPYGTGLSVQDIQEVVADYPGVAAGFDANEDLNELEDADSFYNLPEINDEYAKLEQKIEQQGLIGSEIDIVSNAGKKIGIQLSNNVDSVNFVSTPPSNFSEIMENISLDVLDEAHDLDDLDSAYIQLGNEVNAGQNTFATQSKIDEIENKISQRDFESTMDEMYATEGPRSVSEYLGDPKNYESGELDTDMVNEYINKYDKTVNTTGQGFQEFSLIQNAVNNAKNTILQAARMDEPGADVETEELNTIAQYANQRAEDEEEIPTLPGRPPRKTPFEETRDPYELSDLDPEFDEVVNTGYMGDDAARRELAREMGLTNISEPQSAAEAASGLMNVDTTNLPTGSPTLEEMIQANEAAKAPSIPEWLQGTGPTPLGITPSATPATTTTAPVQQAVQQQAPAQEAAANQAAQQAAAQQQAQQQAAAAAAAAANPIVAPATKPAEKIAAEIAQYNTNLANIPTIANNYADWSSAKQMQYDDDTWDEGQMMPRGLSVGVNLPLVILMPLCLKVLVKEWPLNNNF